MTTVTGLTADRMLAIEAASVIDGDVDGSGNLILTKHDGTQINAGSVIGPPGPQGPIGAMLSVLSAAGILDVGLSNQIRAGRQLSPADFANIGLNAPLGLWNLSDLSDASGNGRALSNKGAVPFSSGINGVANTAAQFSGNGTQVLYIPDTGSADPFRIKTGSIGCWVRTDKKLTDEIAFSKVLSNGQLAWQLYVSSGNLAGVTLGYTALGVGGAVGVDFGSMSGVSEISDDRWHFIVATMDALNVRLYVDGILESSGNMLGVLYPGSGPVNVGGRAGDSSQNATLYFFGRVDEAFITADILSEDQIRNLYCAKIPHTLAAVPVRVSMNVRRRKKGPALAVADFPTQPLRLYNFSAGSAADQGSNNVTLTSARLGVNMVSGVDGSQNNAYYYNGNPGTDFAGTDTGLPSGLAPRSYGCWIRVAASPSTVYAILNWGTISTGEARIDIVSSGIIRSLSNGDAVSGPYVCDGMWHFIVAAEDNGALDGVKRKLYVDGRLVGISTVLNTIILSGANKFHIGSMLDGTNPTVGLIDTAFVCDYVLTADQVHTLYAKGSQALSPSPKNVGDHVEGMDAANLYAIFDTLDSQHQIDLAVA
jgi:hypothetical protein